MFTSKVFAVVRVAAGCLLVALSVPSLAKDSTLRQPLELAWFNDTQSQVAALSRTPFECVKPLDDARFNLGRLAFNSPRLLGGQAGRMGLSCASCHPSGRANSKFFIQQISDQPGRADISHHFLSSQGGDKVFNPKPIPDLADVKKLRFKNRSDAVFDELLVRLIEVEFDGQPASASVFESLKLYIGQNDIRYCDALSQTILRTLETDWSLIEDGLIALTHSITVNDSETTQFVVASMRATIETIYRFYAITPIKSLDDSLIVASRLLQRLPGEQDKEARLYLVTDLSNLLSGIKTDLIQHEDASFYNAEVAIDYLNSSD